MGNVMELLYDLLVKPRAAMEEIVEGGTVSQAFFIVACTSALTMLAAFSGSFAGYLLIMAVAFFMLKWSVLAALWHLLAELVGGQGSVKRLLIATGFASFIEILIIPVYLLDHVMQSGALGLTALAGVAIVVWSAFLQILAIRATYHMSGARAALVFFLPSLLLILFCVIFAGALYSVMSSAASQFFMNPPQF